MLNPTSLVPFPRKGVAYTTKTQQTSRHSIPDATCCNCSTVQPRHGTCIDERGRATNCHSLLELRASTAAGHAMAETTSAAACCDAPVSADVLCRHWAVAAQWPILILQAPQQQPSRHHKNKSTQLLLPASCLPLQTVQGRKAWSNSVAADWLLRSTGQDSRSQVTWGMQGIAACLAA